jgi:hypothetical protein
MRSEAAGMMMSSVQLQGIGRHPPRRDVTLEMVVRVGVTIPK